jgi:hypothetical protein
MRADVLSLFIHNAEPTEGMHDACCQHGARHGASDVAPQRDRTSWAPKRRNRGALGAEPLPSTPWTLPDGRITRPRRPPPACHRLRSHASYPTREISGIALQPCSTCPDPASGTGASVPTRGVGRNPSVTHYSVHPLTQRRTACGPPACPTCRSQRAARVEVPARRDAVIWASRAARATPPRPRPSQLVLSRSHGCCSNRAPLACPISR